MNLIAWQQQPTARSNLATKNKGIHTRQMPAFTVSQNLIQLCIHCKCKSQAIAATSLKCHNIIVSSFLALNYQFQKFTSTLDCKKSLHKKTNLKLIWRFRSAEVLQVEVFASYNKKLTTKAVSLYVLVKKT